MPRYNLDRVIFPASTHALASGRPSASGRLRRMPHEGRFDVVVAWALDRLGRSPPDLLGTFGELEAAGVALVLHEQAIDTTTPDEFPATRWLHQRR
jgi:DNA invertase Pin-like site-specific DNA recombinase